LEPSTIPRTREYALLVVSGGCLVLAFPPVDFVPAAFLALVPFFFVVTRTRPRGFWSAFRPGLVAGVAFFLPLLYWLVFLSSLEVKSPVVMIGPLILLVLLQAFYWGLFSAASSFVAARTRLPAWLFLPLFWVACEQLRSLFVLGFTWGALGYAGVPMPEAIQFASATGVFGVSFWLALANALVLEAAFASPAALRKVVVALAIVVGLPIAHGRMTVGQWDDRPSIRVAVIQPNVGAEWKWDERFKDESFDILGELTREAAREGPDLVVWPETAAPSYLLHEPEYFAKVAGVARELGVPILTGCPDIEVTDDSRRSVRTYNSVLLVGPDGAAKAKYDKMHLVPFGEFIPFQTVFPALERVDLGEADFSPGQERVVFELPEARFSVLVCFESTFPRLVRLFVHDGAEFLVNVTNDVWYGRTSMPFQHASIAVMRSIETHRSLARSANSGVSLLVDPGGRILRELGIFERGYLVDDLPVVTEETFYARYGDIFPWAVSALALALVLYTCLPTRRSRGLAISHT